MATDIAPPTLDDGAAPPTSPFVSLLARLRAFWQPRRRQALALILLLAAFSNFYELQRNGYANLYYCGGHPQYAGELAQLLLCLVRSRRLRQRR